MAYLIVFFSSLAVDSVPIFAPPAWMILTFLLVKFNLNPWLVIPIGVAGCTLGRLLLSRFIVPWIGSKALSKKEDANLSFLGKQLSKSRIHTFIFVGLYSISPLSTTALFTAVGLAKVSLWFVIPPFIIGRLIGDGALILSGKYAVNSLQEIFQGTFSMKGIITAALGLLAILIFLFIDWQKLFTKKKLRFNFKIFKWGKQKEII